MPKTRGGMPQLPEQSESCPCAGPTRCTPHLPDSAPQSRYHTRRASATPVAPTQIPPRSPPTKKPRLQSQESPLEHLGIHRYFGARQIAEAFHIPYAPADPTAFRRWAPLSEWDMVHPHSEPAAIVERASLLTNGIRYGSISIPQNFPSQGKSLPLSSTSAPSEPVPEAASSDPTCCSSYLRAAHYYPWCRVSCLARSFQTLTTTQTAIMERMDHFQLQQDQQTLILREIQQHLGLLPPAPPVAVPSSVPAEDPSYPPEEPTT
ncbi:hypothetical protein CK203_066303 [Vitis vinifera]|uniref:Uncharacterized protein n=1 Tax=Vitis vinifera TaxID=29760 RepID=A0A438FNJ8_VITVI|nr:hypothetical protein CK203_066303 [Vitis vinifera]